MGWVGMSLGKLLCGSASRYENRKGDECFESATELPYWTIATDDLPEVVIFQFPLVCMCYFYALLWLSGRFVWEDCGAIVVRRENRSHLAPSMIEPIDGRRLLPSTTRPVLKIREGFQSVFSGAPPQCCFNTPSPSI